MDVKETHQPNTKGGNFSEISTFLRYERNNFIGVGHLNNRNQIEMQSLELLAHLTVTVKHCSRFLAKPPRNQTSNNARKHE